MRRSPFLAVATACIAAAAPASLQAQDPEPADSVAAADDSTIADRDEVTPRAPRPRGERNACPREVPDRPESRVRRHGPCAEAMRRGLWLGPNGEVVRMNVDGPAGYRETMVNVGLTLTYDGRD